MDELIAKLEQAGKGSRELDLAICAALGIDLEYSGLASAHTGKPEYFPPQPFTSSVDAALSLVPEGWWLTGMGESRSQIVYANDIHEPTGSFWAKVQHVKGGRLTIGTGGTLALALCTASLHARARSIQERG